MSRRIAVVAVSMVASVLFAGGSSAQAATVGAVVTPSASKTCSGESGTPDTEIQLRSPGMQYAIPYSGVITSWSYLAAGTPGRLALFVGKVVGEEHTAILPGYPYNRAVVQEVGESEAVYPAADLLSTFPTRIPVQAGDIIGLNATLKSQCTAISGPSYEMAFGTPAGVGATNNFSIREENEQQVDVSARLEPDADGDGYGDETQDQCPSNASTQGACPVPSVPAPSSPSGGSSTGGQPEPTPIQPVCIPPKQTALKGRSLKQSRSVIRRSHCRVGRIIKKSSSRKGPFVVANVSTKNGKVNITLRRKAKSRAHRHA